MKTTAALLALIMLVAVRPASARPLSDAERRIVARVDANVEAATKLLERVVSINSATQNLAGVKAVGDVFAAELKAMGFTIRWSDMPPGMKRAGHLIADHRGTRGKRLLLLGHLDTVLEGEKFLRSGSEARGSGVSDMKGGDVILLSALKALHDTGALDERQMTVILTGDEESAGDPLTVSRRDLVEAAKRSDVALSFEETIRNTATTARRGASFWTLEVTGSTGHSSGIFGPDRGSGAIFEAARILSAFHQQLRGETYLTFNPSVIVGGTDVQFTGAEGSAIGKTNVVPQKVVVRGDLRFISEAQKESVRTRMRTIVSQHLPRTSATITFEDAYPAMSPTDANAALLRELSRVSEDLGAGPVTAVDAGERGAGDISFVAPLLPGLDGLGIRGNGISHAPGEAADLGSMPMLIKRAALLMYRLTR